MLPNWLKQLAAECPEEDARQLEEKIMTDRQKRYVKNQSAKGLEYCRVMVPVGDKPKIQKLAAQLREKHRASGSK